MLPPNALDARIEQLRREGEEESLAAQGAPVPNHPGLTVRDLANALIAGAVRNGYLEDLHAGRSSPVLLEPAISRITDDEMKKLMIESSRLPSWGCGCTSSSRSPKPLLPGFATPAPSRSDGSARPCAASSPHTGAEGQGAWAAAPPSTPPGASVHAAAAPSSLPSGSSNPSTF
jgi:hypothetical protein